MNALKQLFEPWMATSRRRFTLLITGVILISMVMVSISFTLYRTSGVAQIDMSQSRYQSVRGQTNSDDAAQAFSATGVLDAGTAREFLSQYDARTQKIIPVQNFSNDALSDRSLGLEVNAQPAATAPTF